jgi:hypothetical protein
MELAITRVPAIGPAEVITLINGPEAFTPDGEFVMGEAPDVGGFFVAAGFCAHGIAGAGGVGKVMAEWILDGRPSIDVWRMDLRRFGAHYGDRGHARAQALETYSTYYDIRYPGEERRTGRGLKRSPAYARVEALGGAFGEKAGWERPNWIEANAAHSPRSWTPRGWSARHWSTAIEAEHRAARERAVLFDETSFSKLEVSGTGALGALQRLADNDLDKPVGAVTYTQLLNGPRRDRVRSDRDPRRHGSLHARHRQRLRASRSRLGPLPRRRRSRCRGRGRDGSLCVSRPLRAASARGPRLRDE